MKQIISLLALFCLSIPNSMAATAGPVAASVNPSAGRVTNLNQITVTFSEAVSGVRASDLLVNGVNALELEPLTSSTYVFNFLQPAPGTISIGWAKDHQIAGAASAAPFDASAASANWSYDLVDATPPALLSITPRPDSTLLALTNVSVLFTEPVSGVQASDLLLNGNPATGLQVSGSNEYTFSFPQPLAGVVNVAWATNHGIIDSASPANLFAGGSWRYNLDTSGAASTPYISEFMASNTKTLSDEPKIFPDWIEIYNPGPFAVNLEGWYLTDSSKDLTKWRFPSTNLNAGGFLVVFASGLDRRIPGARLHASFQLSSDGEYLALVKPDGNTVANEFNFGPQALDVSYGLSQFDNGKTLSAGTNAVYFTTPTPGAPNLGGSTRAGPIIQDAGHTPNVPSDDQDLLVTARVTPSFFPVTSVQMRYRIMFSNEVTTAMFDDGAHGDGAAGDGIFGAAIPANLSTNGQMIRYLISAVDSQNTTSRWPLFSNPANTAEYLGTIVETTNLVSKLPIFQLFISSANLPKVDTEGGGRVSFFYDGEFYDNIYMELRGNTSAGYNKKSHRLEFNRDHELRHPGPGGRTRKTSLLAEYVDPTYIRQYLCFWLLNKIGVPAPFHYPVRVQLNGAFYQLAMHNEVIGQEQMERMGYDPAGALYKAVGTFTTDFYSTGVFQKLEPDNDTTRTDYSQLASGIRETSTATVRKATVFDRLDVSEVINHLAGARWCSENDDVWANMSAYRDTFGDQLWRLIPFDMNASWGQLYGGSSPLEATVDASKSHPLYGGSTTGGTWNRLYDVIVVLPETRAMLLRRERSIMDQVIQPPETPASELIIENHIKYMTNLIAVEANLDRAKWGFSPWAGGKTFAAGVGDLLTQFVGPRRRHWYVTHSVTNTSKAIGIRNANNAGIPLAQPPNGYLVVAGIEFNPSSGDQNQEFLCVSNPAPFALDISGWKVDGAFNFTFTPGTVLPSNSVAYVSPSTRSFRARAASPKGGEGLFVVGPARGKLSARGGTLRIKNEFGQTVHTFSYAGAPSLPQQFLRVSEIMFHPTAHPASTNAEDFEYIELQNISTNVTLNLSGIRFTNGIDFSFSGSAVTNLAPGAHVLVVRNLAAFSARHGAGLPVAGEYLGNLDNQGERLSLLDASNEEILEIEYNNSWQPLADGLGFSLVAGNLLADPSEWSSKSQWHLSAAFGGSPGLGEAPPPPAPTVVISEILTRDDSGARPDSIELFNPGPTAVNLSGWWLTDDFNNPGKFRIPDGTIVPAGTYRVFTENDFNKSGNGFAFDAEGDEVWLFSADSTGRLAGYFHEHKFGAADDGVSFGLHKTSDGRDLLVAQRSATLGSANAGPRVGPIVLSEIMYHPTDLADGADNAGDEYLEVLNISSNTVSLANWKVSGGVDFTFPPDQSLARGEALLLVHFPVTNTTRLAEFRSKYGISTTVRIAGPYEGQLDNSSQNIELKRPAVGLSNSSYILVERVNYRDSAPWPAGADGAGLSLHRRDLLAFGDDPANWLGAPPSPGIPAPSGAVPAIVAQPHDQRVVLDSGAVLTITAAGPGPLQYQWLFEAKAIPGATNNFLQIPRVTPALAGAYSVLVFNNSGSILSSNAFVSITYPPTFPMPPLNVQARVAPDPQAVPTNATFSVTAFSAAPLKYQWRFNGVEIPGATDSTLVITNVQLSHGGEYSVAVSDGATTQITPPAILYPLVSPSIVQPPVNLVVAVGAPVTLSVAASGSPFPINYEWRMGTTPLATNSVPALVNFHTIKATNFPTTLQYSVTLKNMAYTGALTNAQFTITTLADSDGDGIPDEYEAQHGKGGQLDPNADDDGDGMTNLAEYLAGTDPADPRSFLRIDRLTAKPGANIQFQAAANRTYTIEYTDLLGSPLWQRLADRQAQAADHLETITDPDYRTNRFYRLVLPRRP